MSEMLERQMKFFAYICRWGNAILTRGYMATLGHAYRCPDCKTGKPNSLHKDRLAMDINLFKDGRYLTTTEEWRECGELWEQITGDGAWGGRFSDANHLSLPTGDGRK